MAVSDCRKTEKKLDFLTIEKRYSFSILFFSVFLFPIFFFIPYSLFSFFRREKSQKKTKRVNEKEEGFPPGPPVSLYKK